MVIKYWDGKKIVTSGTAYKKGTTKAPIGKAILKSTEDRIVVTLK